MTSTTINMIKSPLHVVFAVFSENAGPDLKAYVRYPMLQTWGFQCCEKEERGKMVSTARQKQGTLQAKLSVRDVGVVEKTGQTICDIYGRSCQNTTLIVAYRVRLVWPTAKL